MGLATGLAPTEPTLLIRCARTVAEAIDIFGIGIMAVGIAIATLLFLRGLSRSAERQSAIHEYKLRIGRVMLLALEVLVAADIVKTVALEMTVANVASLGLLVIVRTFLSWTLTLETEGHWPWQAKR